ncbi:MAG: T6SS effector BTH_I2691 family protein, partial [Rouxiella aceris]|uniref:T6SS effector BTH_I2691 family protein n=1 Tax=Rouxiella aceris TaxID=2703884 RepID=UPI002843374C
GFLYIWADSGQYWKSYFATADGYYYPLPEHGDVPPDIVSGKVKPCISKPTELAAASLVTLPVKPLGMKNGLFWFSWSEVAWTDAVRKQHEDTVYRSQYMQRFDMDAWVTSGKAEQALPISGLSDIVAEYSSKAQRSDQPQWSRAPWKTVRPGESGHLQRAAETLFTGKGAIILLQDPVAVAQDISWLANYRINQNLYQNPRYTRELALSAAVQGLKESICAQYERSIVFNNQVEEINAGVGSFKANGVFIPGSSAMEERLRMRNIQQLSQKIEKKWEAEYGKYYDKAKENAFTDAFNAALKQYDENIIVPMMHMYIECMDGCILGDYFLHNFDTTDPASGIGYVQSVTDCINGSQDKLLVSKYFQLKIAGVCTDKSNILARAAVFNNDAYAEQVNTTTQASIDINALPWDRPADGFKDIFDQKIGAAQLVLEKYQNALSAAVYSLTEKAINSKPVDALVSFAVVANKRVHVITLTAERKHFVTAVVGELAEIFGISGRASIDQLRHYVDIEVRHIEAMNMKMSGMQTSSFATLVDLDAVATAKATGTKAAPAVAKTLRSVEEVKATIFPNTFRSRLARLKATSPFSLSASTMKAIPLAGSVISGAFQIFALNHAGLPKTFTVESTSRFAGNILMAAGSVADSIERVLTNFKEIRWRAQIRVAMGGYFERNMMTMIRSVKWLGGAAGIIGVVFDFFNMGKEFTKGNMGTGIAYGLSGTGGGILTYGALFSVVLSPAWVIIAVVLMLGAAIYLALNIKNETQLWLMSCLWRKIPSGVNNAPEIWPASSIEIEALGKALESGI